MSTLPRSSFDRLRSCFPPRERRWAGAGDSIVGRPAPVTDLSYRSAERADAMGISALVKDALLPLTLPEWTPEAVSSLLAKASPEALAEHIGAAAFAHVCVDARRVVGFILCTSWHFLNLLVVAPSFQRRGIGSYLVRLLFRHVADAASDLSVIEVNATRYSFPFYRRLGFYPLSEFIDFDGCRFVRLGYWRKNPLLPTSEC
jgi:ribosomal protein S18 acetylase RimI-like enzyme